MKELYRFQISLLKASLLLMFAILPILIFHFCIDPYGVFLRIYNHSPIEPNKRYIKTKHILENPNEFDSFIFGNSRINAFQSDKFPDGNWYNMSYSIGTPSNHLEEIKLFLEKGVRIKQLLIGIDHTGLIEQNKVNENDLLRKRYPHDFLEKIKFYKSYLFYVPSMEFMKTVLSKSLYDWALLDKYGYIKSVHNTYLTAPLSHVTSPTFSEKYVYLERYPDIEKNISEIKEIKKLADNHGIKVTFFLNPVFHTAYTTMNLPAYFNSLKSLADVTPFYDFSGIHEETLNKCHYHESSHYTAELADSIANIIFDKKRISDFGFGTYVDASNIQKHITSHFTALNRYYTAKNLYQSQDNNLSRKVFTPEAASMKKRNKARGKFEIYEDTLLVSSPLFALKVRIPLEKEIKKYKIVADNQFSIPIIQIDTVIAASGEEKYNYWISSHDLKEGVQALTLTYTLSSNPIPEDQIFVHVAGVEGISKLKDKCPHAKPTGMGNIDQFHVVTFESSESKILKGLVNLEGWLAHSQKIKPVDEILVQYHNHLYPVHFRTYRSDVNAYLDVKSEQLFGFYITVPFFEKEIKKSDFQFLLLDKKSGQCEIYLPSHE